MKDYRRYSYWLETAGDDLTPRPGLDGPITADVAILGAGYSGLWTAYYLLRRRPSLQIAIIEREIAGFGGSGRNGGWCTSGFPLSLTLLEERFGCESARAMQMAMYDAVDEVGRVCAREAIDAHFLKSGALRIARGRHQLPAMEDAYAAYERLGLADHYGLLDREETAERIQVTKALGALLIKDCASLHPGRLVRGLARVVEQCGARMYEQTEVTTFNTGATPSFTTTHGEVRAGTIILAGDAYLTRIPALHRQLIPLYSLIVLTEPLSEEHWRAIGWRRRECVSSNRYTVDYLIRTCEGRILFGSRGAPYHYASRIDDRYDRHRPTRQMIERLVVEWFPMLRGVAFTHTWAGPVGMPRDWMPTVSYDREIGVATARGYTGQGVAISNLAGRLLADLITDSESPLTALPLNGHRSPRWEPEPLRWLAIRAIQAGYARLDSRAERTGRAPTGRTLVERLGRH